MSTLDLIFLIAVVLVVAGLGIWSCVRTIPRETTEFVERFGRSRTLRPGLHVVIPFVDRVRALIDLREQVVTLQPQVLTRDKMRVEIETVISFRVTNAYKAVYAVNDYKSALQEHTTITLAKVAARVDVETALRSRKRFNRALMAELGRAARAWGVQISRAELKTLEPPSAFLEFMEKKKRAEHEMEEQRKRAENDKHAADLRAQGRSNEIVMKAIAEETAQAMWAEGQAESITRVFRTIAAEDTQRRLLIYEWLRTQAGWLPVSPDFGRASPDGQGPNGQGPDGLGPDGLEPVVPPPRPAEDSGTD
jgi:regulator of protease activity HflC (stomatin/prohibitin superfamily)